MISRSRRMMTRSAGSDVITRGSSPRLCIGRAVIRLEAAGMAVLR